ncbi:hypothetical protein ASPBRDRAFT_604685 [Aspergillus brasiliensis CBS 101740]|uniref:Uncharacterized protein n=1 Tax=Aspergillus brasiliensis (strain CBS 101740 / IMI 381727 / IBT 21946) TaxID=767769 RepID=A0A1L9UHK0_ASPBC|nr:hypothetical protein ASPBRDRAFT_604685 [Aspergillus brasiliensis CBS 101740]
MTERRSFSSPSTSKTNLKQQTHEPSPRTLKGSHTPLALADTSLKINSKTLHISSQNQGHTPKSVGNLIRKHYSARD